MASSINASTTSGIVQTADTSGILNLQTANTTAVTIDASQNVGIGITNPAYKAVVSNSGAEGFEIGTGYSSGKNLFQSYNRATSSYVQADNVASVHTWQISGSEKMRLDTSGNVGIGVTPSAWRTVYRAEQIGSSGAVSSRTDTSSINISSNWYENTSSVDTYITTGNATRYHQFSGAHTWYTAASGTAGNPITFTQAMTLDASGNLLVGTTSGTQKFVVAGSVASDFIAGFNSTIGSGNSYGVWSSITTAPNNTLSSFFYGSDSSVARFIARSNGGLANYSANNVNLSDERTKKDIVNAGNYLDKICAIPVRTFLYKDQTDNLLNLGVIAQEVEAVAPELVDLSGFGETPEDGVPLKAIYQTDLQYALMKCIQEQQALITSLTARLEVLENK